uniref:Zinc finger protein 692 n=1 Tax=Rousettus aegyptiacus TaxID=9407 RepID=A0A7J8FPM7_ROUAE|nr:zinc finger protein 692 [Rousettus aegyptiacus]
MAASLADASRRRRENRRQLDARRSKCRIRLGGHMEQWCLLKERLGFSLHSQLAKFLLDRYTSSGCVLCAAESAVWYLGCVGLGAEMGGLCGSAQQATHSPGALLQDLHLPRRPS